MLEDWERHPRGAGFPEAGYGRGVMEMLSGDEELAPRLREAARRVHEAWSGGGAFAESSGAPEEAVVRDIEHLRFGLMEHLGAAPADWDFYDPEGGGMTRDQAVLIPAGVYLDDIRSPFNVGAIFRTAEAFGAEHVHLSAYTADPEHKRAYRTSMGCVEILPWSRTALEALDDEPFLALEVGGTPVEEFEFPARGIVAIGSEELGISPEVRRRAQESRGIVSIATGGAKGSLNVSVAFGILMHRWFAALREAGRR